MIDTVKVYTFISRNIYNKIKYMSDIKCMYNINTDHIYYEIVNSSLKGSYDTNFSVRVSEASKYSMSGYVLELEGSYHKMMKGHNAYDGFYNLQQITLGFKKIVELEYDVKLPNLRHWFLQRIDITKTFNLSTNENVIFYINNFKNMTFPRRKIKFYEDGTLYFSGQTTTLKIYNKLLEFNAHDRARLKKFDNFDLQNFENKIQGLVRFECEIKKKKLISLFGNKFVRISNLNYDLFEKIWSDEFLKVLKFSNVDIKKVNEKNEVLQRLNTFFESRKAIDLYNFYLSLKIDGYNVIKNLTPKTTFYRKVKILKDCGIDFTSSNYQILGIVNNYVFDPFVEIEREVS